MRTRGGGKMTFRAVRDCGQTHGQPVIDGTTSKLNVATTNTLQHLSCKTTEHCSAVQLTELFHCIAKSGRSTLVQQAPDWLDTACSTTQCACYIVRCYSLARCIAQWLLFSSGVRALSVLIWFVRSCSLLCWHIGSTLVQLLISIAWTLPALIFFWQDWIPASDTIGQWFGSLLQPFHIGACHCMQPAHCICISLSKPKSRILPKPTLV